MNAVAAAGRRDVRTFSHKLRRDGRLGYGFTLSGECPPVLTTVLPKSASGRAGLVPGLLLLEVDGRDVTRLEHEDVVKLVARTRDSVRLVVSEANFDVEEFLAVQGRERKMRDAAAAAAAAEDDDESSFSVPISQAYDSPHFGSGGGDRKLATSRYQSLHLALAEGRGGKDAVLTSRSGNNDTSMISRSGNHDTSKTSRSGNHDSSMTSRSGGYSGTIDTSMTSRYGNSLSSRRDPNTSTTAASFEDAVSGDDDLPLLRFVVDYYGSVQLPTAKTTEHGSVETIRRCVARVQDVRRGARGAATVTMEVTRTGLKLINVQGRRLLEISSSLFSYSGLCLDDRRFFGMVTKPSSPREPGSCALCHVFMADGTRAHSSDILGGVARLFKDGRNRRRKATAAHPEANGNNDWLKSWNDRSHPSLDAQDLPPPPADWLDNYVDGGGFVAQSTPLCTARVPLSHSLDADPTAVSAHTGRRFHELSGFDEKTTTTTMNVAAAAAGATTKSVEELRPESELTGVILPATSTPMRSREDDDDDDVLATGRRERHRTIEGGALVQQVEINRNGAPRPTRRMTRHGSLGYGIDETPDEDEKGLPDDDSTFGGLRRVVGVLSASVDSLALASTTPSEAAMKTELNVGRVASWALSLRRVLDDNEGVACFKEFMKTELNDENLLFWLECRKFVDLKDPKAMKSRAREIYDQYLSSSSPTPVNVDCHTVQRVAESLDDAQSDIFARAQREIFSLMKLDCHPRFIRSTLYQQCVIAELENLPLPIDPPSPQAAAKNKRGAKKTKKKRRGKRNGSASADVSFDLNASRSSGYDSVEEKKKKSRWGRRSKPKSSKEDLNDSKRTSTATESSEGEPTKIPAKKDLTVTFAPVPGSQKDNFYRVVMPDSSSTIIMAEHGQTVAQTLAALFERRGLDFSSFQVVIQSNGEVVPYEAPASCLHNKEVRLQKAGLTFKATFETGETATTTKVRVDKRRTIREVLGAVMTERGLSLESHVIHLENCPVPLQLDIASSLLARQSVVIKPQSTLTNGDLGGEADSTRQTTAPNARTSSERNNGGGFFHKLGSLRLPGFRRSADVEGAMKKVASLDESGGSSSPSTRPKKSSKKKSSSLDKSSSVETPESPDDFMDLLSRVQGDRIDDQRVSVYDDDNFQLPDFLREDAPSPASVKKKSPSPEHDPSPSQSRESGYHSVSPPVHASPRAPYVRPPAAPLAPPASNSVPDLSPTEEREFVPHRHGGGGGNARSISTPDPRLRRKRDTTQAYRRGASVPDLDNWKLEKPALQRQRKLVGDEDENPVIGPETLV